MERNIYLDNKELAKAKAIWHDSLNLKAKTEKINITQAQGRISAEPLSSRVASPHYPASAMDGIAVKAESTAGASERNPIFLAEDEFELIDTGDPLADKYDAVIMIEYINLVDGQARIEQAVVPGDNVRAVGESLQQGQLIIPSNKEISAYDIGLALEGAQKEIEVFAQPQVGVIPTGTELVEFKADLKPGEVIESNSYVLSNLAEKWGAKGNKYEIVVDDYQLIKKQLAKAVKENDFVAITAGSSAGREDYTANVIAELGEVLVHGVSIRPGGPVILGVVDDTPVMGVPGYPVASALTFRLFAKEIILKLGQRKNLASKTIKAKLATKVVSKLGYREFLRVKVAELNGELVVRSLKRAAGVMGSLAEADGIVEIAESSEGLCAGSEVEIELFKLKISPEKTLFLSGSYHLALDRLKDLYKQAGYNLSFFAQGNQGGVASLARGEAHLAGVYLIEEREGESYLNRFLGDDFSTITLAENIPLKEVKADLSDISTGNKVDNLRYELIIPGSVKTDERWQKLADIIQNLVSHRF